ncbi:MAG: ribose ABC transporter permease [Bacteroidota bacterium]
MPADIVAFRRIVSEYGIGIVFILELALFSVLSPHFATVDNLLNVSLQTSITAIIAVGMTFVILTAGIDLSVGSLVAFAGVVTTFGLRLDVPLPAAYVLGIGMGLFFGICSGGLAGLFVTKFRITPFIVTLALMTIWRGAAFVATEGRPIWELPEGFAEIARGRLFFIPVPTLIMLTVFGAAHFTLTQTRFGRYVYAVGGNLEAARLAGINTNSVLLKVYVISGVLSALSGILLASRVNSGQPNAGLMYELDVIAAVVVGGTSLFGGKGTVLGTLIGSLLIGVLRNGLNLMNVESYVQQVVVGVVILLAVLLDRLRKGH